MSTKEKELNKFTTEQDLAFIQRHKDAIVKQVGETVYDRMVTTLEEHLKRRERPGRVASKPSNEATP